MTIAEKNNSRKAFPPLTLEATAFTEGQFIFPEAPQVAFAGRSNVGKSSLINALAGRKALAKVSATPGKTRSINYYRLAGFDAFLVDLPGYGYAKCSHEERNTWARLMTGYFNNTPGLRGLVVLLDARLPPQAADLEMVAFACAHSLSLLPVLTKTDKCNKKELSACMQAWGVHLDRHSLLPTSAKDKKGVEALWLRLLQLLEITENGL